MGFPSECVDREKGTGCGGVKGPCGSGSLQASEKGVHDGV